MAYKDSKLKREEMLRIMRNLEYEKMQTSEKALKRFKEKPYQLKYMEEHGGR